MIITTMPTYDFSPIRRIIQTVLLAMCLLMAAENIWAMSLKEDIQKNIETVLQTNSCIGCNLRGANFNRALLKHVNLQGADLDGATFFLAVLTGANFQNASLLGTHFGGADITAADFRGANTSSTLFIGVYKKGALFGSIKKNTAAGNPPVTGGEWDKREKNSDEILENTRPIMPEGLNAPPVKRVKSISKVVLPR